jgi:hypothetical protein
VDAIFVVLISEHPKNKCQSNHIRQQAIFYHSKKPLGP